MIFGGILTEEDYISFLMGDLTISMAGYNN